MIIVMLVEDVTVVMLTERSNSYDANEWVMTIVEALIMVVILVGRGDEGVAAVIIVVITMAVEW